MTRFHPSVLPVCVCAVAVWIFVTPVAASRVPQDNLVRTYHDALVDAGVSSYSFDECWDEYACSLLSALLTTIFGAMYGARTERGDRMFELMGARHARQILDLDADRFLDGDVVTS